MWARDPFETIRALAAGMRGGQGLPRFVEQEFRDFLTCGCLALSRMGETVPAIGAGGMGEVYRARDTRLHRDVAVKIISAGSAGDPDRRRRFELTPADSVADPPQNSRGAPEHCTAPFFECSSVPRLAQLFAERANVSAC